MILTMKVKKKALKTLLTLLNAVHLLMYELGSCKNAKTCIG